ncbi:MULTISPECIES: hypothetical protein [Bacillus]|uniref:ABC-2 type transport system permease protein n=1 Tax=Bacillus wiedmannii TaxID=1890302 RepID=A0A2C4MFE8_9BACI|nr:hypothetical protein [Bacillus wiedmannii]PEJ75525.1 hypothetical protein CN888_05035 [Bacillus wiedmannii]PEL18021.1 hypothetical protein CN599_15915 [Bacillus wiedmannii]PEM53119.1 hypothetical protein CN618_04715 [Bacillus wiedmannii]PFZ33076.1 hypothetical protein COL66_05760 [Bacillus wiedmannii]PGD07870.1 hypothetical protein COM34_16215 [Bacillus wiedmannii]
MVSVLIRMKLSFLKNSMNSGKAVLFIITGIVGLLIAIGTILLFSFYPTEHNVSHSILYITFALWTVGWVLGPIIAGGDGILRPEYFALLPFTSYKLARALLVVAFIGLGPIVSLIAFIGLFIYAARVSLTATIVAVPAIILQLIFVVLLSKVVVSIIGETLKSRIGMEVGAMLFGFIIAFLNVGWYVLPAINKMTLSDSTLLYMFPSSWAMLAVEYAIQSNLLLAFVFLMLLTILCGFLFFIWTTLLMKSTETKKIEGRINTNKHRKALRFFSDTKIGATITKELKSWGRDPQRGRFLRMGIWIGVFYGILATSANILYLMPWAGIMMIVFTSMFSCNIYGFDGSALWLTLMTPDAERIDVRGRQFAWLLAVGPIAIITTIIFTISSGLTFIYPWVFAVIPALLGGAAGLIMLFSVCNLVPITDPHRRGRGSVISGDDMNASKMFITTWLMMVMVLATTIPALLVVWLGILLHVQFLQWLGLLTGICTGMFFAWWFGRIAYLKLEKSGSELLFEMKNGMKILHGDNKKKDNGKAVELPKKKLAIVVLLVFMGIFFLIHQSVVPLIFEIFSVDEKVRLFFLPRYVPHIVRIPIIILFAILGTASLYKAIVIKKKHGKEHQFIKDEM